MSQPIADCSLRYDGTATRLEGSTNVVGASWGVDALILKLGAGLNGDEEVTVTVGTENNAGAPPSSVVPSYVLRPSANEVRIVFSANGEPCQSSASVVVARPAARPGLVLAGGPVPAGGGASPRDSVFLYRPGQPDSPRTNTYGDPWALWFAAFASGVPCSVFVDCSIVSPAPWPVDLFDVLFFFYASPITSAPAVLGLVDGTNPQSGAPSSGFLPFLRGLDGVGVVNVSSTAPAMSTAGGLFGQRLEMRNGAYIQRRNAADLQALQVQGSPVFALDIDNCSNPFPNLADAPYVPGVQPATPNVQSYGGDLAVLLRTADAGFHLPSFKSAIAGSKLTIRYEQGVPASQLGEAAWAGPVSLVPLF